MSSEKKDKKENDGLSVTPEKNEGKQSYSGTMKVRSKSATEKTVTIQFKENRKFDLHIGRNMKTFLSRESLPVPASWLQHKDWQNVRHYFNVKGV